jgi:AraC-like DNA-binding protein
MKKGTSSIEQRWLDAVVNEMQTINGLDLIMDPIDTPALMRSFADRIPVPARPTERQLLRGLLLEFALRWSMRLHANAHEGQPAGCAFDVTTFLEGFMNDRSGDARAAFAAWVDWFFPAFVRTHPPSAATHAARQLRRHYARLVNVPTLARTCHTTPQRLVREFRRQFGMSIPQYHRTLRVVTALGRVRHEKVEAVAMSVGYRSTKNFYRALRQLTGLTPTAFRRLSSERAAVVVEVAELALLGRRRRAAG